MPTFYFLKSDMDKELLKRLQRIDDILFDLDYRLDQVEEVLEDIQSGVGAFV